LAGKWLELLKEMAPNITRALVMREPGPAGIGQFTILQALAPSLNVELRPFELRDAASNERAITTFAQQPNSALIVAVSGMSYLHRGQIISLAEKHRLPAAFPYRFFVSAGGLVAYGPDLGRMYRSAASYVDRILKGEKPADLPIQAATKYELAINLKTAKALGLTVPPSVLARADEVIE
jgi:putative ABC transport system substrate-binding protein